MSKDLPAPAIVEAESIRLGLATSACELHGALCGWLAGGGDNGPDWLARVMADAEIPAPAEGSPLDALRLATAAQLADRSFEFELLLPDAEASLAERSGGLFDWCRGFVGAFGLAGGGSREALSAESREALVDLAKLAAAQPQEEGEEEDEEALVEIEEFVRVAALLLHGDSVLAPLHRQRFN